MITRDLSIIIPCYNEGNKLRITVDKIIDFVNSKTEIDDFEIIVVNDGSTDNTIEIGKQLYANEFIKFVTYDKNKGKGYAVKQGIINSSGKWVVFMDADLSTDLNALIKVFENKNNYDVIIGSRRHKETMFVKKQGAVRQIIGKVCSILTNIIIPLNISDTQCGFKAFEGKFAREMVSKQQLNGFAFDVEYLYIAKLKNKKILEIGVNWENDDDSRVSVIKSSIRFFKDLFKIRKNKKLYKGD